jgi:hypothetical protein
LWHRFINSGRGRISLLICGRRTISRQQDIHCLSTITITLGFCWRKLAVFSLCLKGESRHFYSELLRVIESCYLSKIWVKSIL